MSATPVNFDKWFFWEQGEWSEFFVVDSSKTSYFRGDAKVGYEHSISIGLNKMPQSPRVSAVNVMTDLTVYGGKPVVEVAYKDVPDSIKELWAKKVNAALKHANKKEKVIAAENKPMPFK